MSKAPLQLVVVGHVDHGKSTLIGRLLHDLGALTTGKADELRIVSERRGVAIEWSFALDAFQAERDQAVTIDTTRVWLRLPERDCRSKHGGTPICSGSWASSRSPWSSTSSIWSSFRKCGFGSSKRQRGTSLLISD